MKKYLSSLPILFAVLIMVSSCGGGAKDKKGNLGDMRGSLEKLKKEKSTLDQKIRDLESAIAKEDPAAAKVTKLVDTDTIVAGQFQHYIDLQGQIGTDGLSYVAPTGQGGLVKAVYVKSGQKVSKGQVLLKLDDAIARQQLSAAQQQTGVLKARLAQAETILQRYENLWSQGIGAEINVINSKADVEALQSQLRAAMAQVGSAQEQVNMTSIRAELSGTVDQVNVRVGEFFSGMGGDRKAQIVIVNLSDLKMIVPVPDNYVARIKKGDKVEVVVPETGKPAFPSVLSVVGNTIDPTTRSFIAEAKLPSDPLLKPNQRATMKILDYQANDAISVPVNVVQSDETGKYVYVLERSGDKTVARRKTVIAGETYGGRTEIKSGLNAGDQIITEGFLSVYDGQAVTLR
ncbi:MAG: efflux RND transporter periplasmic adaptor subunit [Chitinophagaceae bacterium]|nr:efflux RND transporter periplasmic adaptor subunit [Chitinophagaceae bacterium]